MIVQVIVVNLYAIDGIECVNAKTEGKFDNKEEFISGRPFGMCLLDFFNRDGACAGLMA